jgi:hypothetical protein
MIIDNLIEKYFSRDLRGILILDDTVCPVLEVRSRQKENSGFVLNSLTCFEFVSVKMTTVISHTTVCILQELVAV